MISYLTLRYLPNRGGGGGILGEATPLRGGGKSKEATAACSEPNP